MYQSATKGTFYRTFMHFSLVPLSKRYYSLNYFEEKLKVEKILAENIPITFSTKFVFYYFFRMLIGHWSRTILK